MTVIKIDDGNGQDRTLLEIAEEQAFDMLMVMETIKSRMRETGELEGEGAVKSALDAVRKAISHVFEERKRFDDLRKRNAGIATDHALDLDAARDEIGRRLDRLRAAKGAGDVPG